MSFPRRRFTLLDATILVAATATGFAIARAWGREGAFEMLHRGFPQLRPFDWATLGYRASLPYLWAWTPALVVIRLHPPRRQVRRLARQPGMAACLTATLSMAFVVARTLILSVGVPAAQNRGYSASWWLLQAYAPEVAMTVGGAWFILAIGGWWHPEPSWVDRLGTALAVGWIVVVLFAEFCPLLLP
jgi:hypothetical protein